MSEHGSIALVTGAAGFIGSRLTEMLLDRGWSVVGVDCFTDYYDRSVKEANLRLALQSDAFRLIEDDLNQMDLVSELVGVEVIFHQAAQAGVRDSWGQGFASYVHHNVLATQRLLEGALRSGVQRFVYASSSSVYGNADRYPTLETDPARPFSPYGVTKLAAEHLVSSYARNFGLNSASLRYHTVYGPRQRPDMAIHRLIRSALTGEPFKLFSAADFVRDFTYVDDICAANIAASRVDVQPGEVFNLAGGESISMRDLIEKVGEVVGSVVRIEQQPGQPGDVRRTDADWSKARSILGWEPTVTLNEGLRAQAEWHRGIARLGS